MSSNAPDDLAHPLRQFAERYGVRLLLQFGSTVSGPVHDRSDLDLAIQFTSLDVPFERVLEIQAALADLFPGQAIDLAILNRADPLFLMKISERCRLLYGTTRDLASFRLLAFKQYQDFRPYLELERRYISRRLASLTGTGPSS